MPNSITSTAKLLNFLPDYVVVSDVHRMFAERKTCHTSTVTQNMSFEQHNKQSENTRSVHRQLSRMHLIT